MRDVYLNPKQQTILYGCARHIRLLGSRRFGKTSLLGPYAGKVITSMPRGAGAWLGSSRKQLMARTVPATMATINAFYGWKEGVDYFFGKPPRKLSPVLPVITPKDWSNVLYFRNGFVYYLVSLAVFGSANSLTLNNIIADECKFLPKKKIDSEVMPALSGVTHPLGDRMFSDYNPLYCSTFFASDAAMSNKGNWLEREEKRCDSVIEGGEFGGKTGRELQKELDGYAERVMFFNELLRNGTRKNHTVRVVSEEEKKYFLDLRQRVINREGVFQGAPRWNGELGRNTCTFLESYHFLKPGEGDMVYNAPFLITKDEHFEMLRLRNSKKYREHIRSLRCNTFAFYRTTSFDNIDILGENYIKEMKRSLPPVVFAISILNQRNIHLGDGFYSNLDIENVHGYIPEECPAVRMAEKVKATTYVHAGMTYATNYETVDYDKLGKTSDCSLDGDVMDNLPLHIAFDYGALINWIVVGQLYRRGNVDALNVVNSLFTKNERKLRELVEDFCGYFEPHRKKNNTVFYYYDATAKFRAYALNNAEDFKDVVITTLRKKGWSVVPIDMGTPMAHELKYKDINEGLAGVAYPAIRFNRENNEYLIAAMEHTECTRGYKGFRKDKSGEKVSESEEDLLEFRTDGTDAFDSLYLGVKYFRNRLSGVCAPRIG